MADDATWTARFLGLCDHVASWSEDRDRHVGCVIVGPDGQEVRATGYNGLPRGVSDAPGLASIASEISLSQGGMIWAPLSA